MGSTISVLIFLLAAVTIVPVFNRLGLGSVLGYLVAGVIIGPSVLGIFWDTDGVSVLAEFGVIFLMFIIGLELQPSRLWVLRHSVFGLGTAQVILTALVSMFVTHQLGLAWSSAWIIGLALSLSSTALVLQSLAERHQLTSHHGRGAFSILLFQDLMVIPLLAMMPLFSPGKSESSVSWVGVLIPLAAIAGSIIAGRVFFRPLFRWVARTNSRELFTSMALLLVIGTAALMHSVGLSMALGSFLAGVVLSDSEFKHEIEAGIEPFKGLLLGLFFMTIGIQAKLELLWEKPLAILGLTLLFVFIKFFCIFVMRPLTKNSWSSQRKLAIHLAQGGEFAFVIFGLAVTLQIIARPISDILIIVVTLSMLLAPLLFVFEDRRLSIWLKESEPVREYDKIDTEGTPVLIAGFGRFGQIVGRVLSTRRIKFTALDKNPQQVDFVRRFGNKTFYGDASRLDILKAAKIDQAKVFVLAIDDVESSIAAAETVRRHFPDLPILARARNRAHAYRLMDLQVQVLERETFLGSLNVAHSTLLSLGLGEDVARETIRRFQAKDLELLNQQHEVYKDEKLLMATAKQAISELENLFESDVPVDIQENRAQV